MREYGGSKMKKTKNCILRIFSLLLVAAMLVALAPGLRTDAAAKKKGWVKSKGYSYYYKDGKMAAGFTKIGKNTYYFAPKKIKVSFTVNRVTNKEKTAVPKGAALKGWYKIDNDYYYFDRSTGKMAKSKTVDGIKINKSGKAKKNSYSTRKIEVMIMARERVQYLTAAKDSKNVKKKKIFNYVKNNFTKGLAYGDKGLVIFEKVRNKKDWDVTEAEIGYNYMIGDCFTCNVSFAYMLHECGFSKVYVADNHVEGSKYDQDNPDHGWVFSEGKVYDPYLASMNFKNVYNTGYKYNNTGKFEWIPTGMKEISSGKVTKISAE